MFDSKYGSVLTILLIIVIVAIVAIIGYFGYEIIAEKSKEKASESAMEKFDTTFPTVAAANENEVQNSSATNGVLETNSISGGNGGNSGNGNSKKVMMEGYEVIGTIRIPSVDVKEPILEEVTKKSLETAVALLYTTNGLNQPGNSVIIGHNYRNNLFFSNNDKIEKGDSIYIKDKTGVELKYKVTDTFETSASDADFYKPKDVNKTTIVLSTCTDDASTTNKRWIVMAELEG